MLDCKLEYLKFIRCEGLSKVPKGLYHLTSLQELEIYGCASLVSFPDVGLSPSLKVVRIEECKSLMYFAKYQIPPNLRRIEIIWCKRLKSLVEEEAKDEVVGSSSSSSLEHLEISIDMCNSLVYFAKYQIPPNLRRIEIRECNSLKSLVEDEAVGSSSSCSLEHLEISGCESLTSLSFRGQYFPRALKHLQICYCEQLELITSDGFFFDDHTHYCLECMDISNCQILKCLPEGLCHLTNLQSLYIEYCKSLVSIPRLSGGLRHIWILSCDKLEQIPDMHNFNYLVKLTIDYREGFTSIPPNLISPYISGIDGCKWLCELGLHRLTSLTHLTIRGKDPDVVSFPPVQMETLLPKSLTHLTIEGFPNLKKLSSKDFQFITSLESLRLSVCPKLASIPLPEEGLPLSLTQLYILGCPVLKERFQLGSKGRFSYWPKLSHIPYIELDVKKI